MSGLAIFTLIRGGHDRLAYATFEASRECLESSMPYSLTWSDIAFHEGNVPLNIERELTTAMYSGARAIKPTLRFVDVRDHGGFSHTVDIPAALASGESDGYAIGYRHMCHFMSFVWFEALAEF